MPSLVTHLTCSRCGRNRAADLPANVCDCGGPLLVEYDLHAVGGATSKEAVAAGPTTMWRYGPLLPAPDASAVVSLGEGFTPLLPIAAIGREMGLPHLLLKDEGGNPTGSFKARGASCGVTMARALGVREVALPTAGNAGGAWAAYGAAAGLAVHVVMPADAPKINSLECRAYGADVSSVNGLISDAGRAVADGVARNGWFDVATLREPYRIEGKKTLGFEIAEQLEWRFPDAIVYPAGGGVGIIGIHRALRQLRELGWVIGDLPRSIVVQAEGCAPIVRAFEEGAEESRVWEQAETIAAGLRVPKALGDFLVLRAVRETGGTAVAVSDDEILSAMRLLAEGAGVLAAPEGAATVAAARRLRDGGDLRESDRVVLINTGSGLKYPEAVGLVVETV